MRWVQSPARGPVTALGDLHTFMAFKLIVF